MIGEPFGLWPCLREGAFYSAIKATVETRLSIGSVTRLRLCARVPPDEDKEGLSAVSQVRQHIEGSFSSLWRRFTDRVYSRSWRGP
jgi:hypothetical protein